MNNYKHKRAANIRSAISVLVITVAAFCMMVYALSVEFGRPREVQAQTDAELQTTPAETTESTLQPLPEPQPQSMGEFKLTAYCSCAKCCGKWAERRPIDEQGDAIVYTASGTIAEAGRTIAVDPSVIPYGTAVVIDGHTYIAEDCGGAIKGNRIDVYFDSHADALEWGVQTIEVFSIN